MIVEEIKVAGATYPEHVDVGAGDGQHRSTAFVALVTDRVECLVDLSRPSNAKKIRS
ncbi:hypothetical protein IB244_19690 [Rhizobium sp. RHZ02]|uniref:hypothetical protein n=1 Tax=Rhizobium sp. RHZ02 TaxID=2769306 RepID=UPI0017868EEE|nr:hypothetical protein [Rhizobium sp. RHZ02]MBD9453750.1 hypothetical protein [Rhizobium sp. RHZ02]